MLLTSVSPSTPLPVHTLLTHENPDMDAMMSVLLMRKFGEKQFPGVSTAQITFASAGRLPDGKTAEALEKEGIMPLDIGGGRFDTHPVNHQLRSDKHQRSATDLVAEELGILQDPNWELLIEYIRIYDSSGQGMRSTDYLHHITALPNVLTGLQLVFTNNSEDKLKTGIELLQVIPTYVKHKASKRAYDAMCQAYLTGVTVEEINPNLGVSTNYISLIDKYVTRYLRERNINIEEPRPEEKQLINWYHRLKQNPKQAFSRNKLDDIVSLKAIIVGGHYYFDEQEDKAFENVITCLDAVIARETNWLKALKDFDDNAVIRELRGATVVGIESEHGLVIKAARYRSKAHIVIYRNPESGATTLLINRKGALHRFGVQNLVAKIRLVEAFEQKEQADYEHLKSLGMVHHWFFHQSEVLLICGSLKATHFVPSKIALPDLLQIVYNEVDWNEPFPFRYIDVYVDYKWQVSHKQ